jgi:hypothetical protein
MQLRIRSYKSKGSEPKENNNKILRRNLILFLIHKFSQVELFYLYQSEVGISCAFAFWRSFSDFYTCNKN